MNKVTPKNNQLRRLVTTFEQEKSRNDGNDEFKRSYRVEKSEQASQRKEFTIFNYQHYYENEVIKRKIKELLNAIRKEIEAIKINQNNLLTEVKDIENLTLNTIEEQPNVYTINFLEIVISVLRNLRKKIGESKTWLEALVTKKKKRGSLFLSRSKKMGTQYSLSQELNTTRSTK